MGAARVEYLKDEMVCLFQHYLYNGLLTKTVQK